MVFAILAVGIFMATLDSSIVNISLPTIAHFFGVPLSGAVEWIIIAYLVVTAGVLLTVGRLADSIGRKPIWIAGLLIFTAGSALIPTCTLRGHSKMGKIGHRVKKLRILLKLSQLVTKSINNG